MNPELFALLSASFSALLAAIGYYTKTKHERRRSTRTALFYLLEIHHVLARAHLGITRFPAEYVERCNATLKKRMLRLSEQDAELLKIALTRVIRDLVIGEFEEQAMGIGQPFEQALRDLAKEDPLLAFELKGKDSISKLSKLVRAIPTNQHLVALASAGQRAPTPTDMDVLDDLLRELTSNELARSIKLTASRCGVFTYGRTLHLLHRSRRVSRMVDISREASEAIDRALEAHLQEVSSRPTVASEA